MSAITRRAVREMLPPSPKRLMASREHERGSGEKKVEAWVQTSPSQPMWAPVPLQTRHAQTQDRHALLTGIALNRNAENDTLNADQTERPEGAYPNSMIWSMTWHKNMEQKQKKTKKFVANLPPVSSGAALDCREYSKELQSTSIVVKSSPTTSFEDEFVHHDANTTDDVCGSVTCSSDSSLEFSACDESSDDEEANFF